MSLMTHHRRWLFGILLTALALRLGVAVLLQQVLDHRLDQRFLIEGDAEGYWELAGKLARGEDYAVHAPPRYALRMPGFPAVLATSVLLFGESLFAARLWLAGVGTLACWLVYLLGRQLFDERTGLIAAGLAALWPVFIVFSVIVLSETAFAATMLLSLLVGHRLLMSLSTVRSEDSSAGGGARWFRIGGLALLTGVCIALACLMRPSWLLAAPLLAVFLVIASKPRWIGVLAGVLVIAGTVLTLLPWGVRNQRVTGHFTLTTLWLGPSLYDGLNPQATGDSDMTFFERDQLTREMTEYEVDRHYRRRAWEFVREHPVRTLELAGAKLVRYWKPWPNAAQFDGWGPRLAVLLFFVPMLLLAGVGIAGCLRTRREAETGEVPLPPAPLPEGERHRPPAGPLTPGPSPPGGEGRNGVAGGRADIWSIVVCVGPILYFAVLHMVFVSSLRYRLPAEYPLLILSAVGLQMIWHRIASRRA
jgi:hypothetical protein